MDVHQCALFYNNQFLVSERAVRHIVKYLTSTSTYVDLPYLNWRLTTCGLVYRPDIENVIDCYVDDEFYGGWDQADDSNAENVMSCTVYITTYTGCPLLWCSKLQTKTRKV